ncbi:MAG: ABC transporter ATP-binding protein [Ruminococcaceae bacterium]|nr:ABC transporter ATP-binding protein [Oscillospiraceae bacterium]
MIEMRAIEKAYPRKVSPVYALRGIDLRVNQGEFAAIIGRSGSGKTTLMNLIGCLDTPTAGSYRLSGRELATASPILRARARNEQIGFIFQNYHLAPHLTALENAELPLLFRGLSGKARRRLAEAALDRVGLSERRRHFPAELSGGQQQRVAIARAIAADPPLLLADEPTGSLDPEAAKRCMALLHELHRDGHTILLITHDLSAAAEAERRITIENGRITQDR